MRRVTLLPLNYTRYDTIVVYKLSVYWQGIPDAPTFGCRGSPPPLLLIFVYLLYIDEVDIHFIFALPTSQITLLSCQ